MKKVSVVIPVYNGENTIGECLESLMEQAFPKDAYEIIVVDDGSTDRTPEVVKKFKVKYVRQENQGPAAARNHGVRLAFGEIILFTDADCIADPGWVEAMSEPFNNHEIVGVKGVYKTKQREVVARFVQAEFEERYEILKRNAFIDFVDTYSAGFRKEIFLMVGGFDPSFPVANNEDVDISYRIAKRGYKMVFNPRAIVYHHHPNNWRKYLRIKFGRGYWRMVVYRRYPDKMVKDSYTPQTLKVQILLFYLGIIGLFGSILLPVIGFCFFMGVLLLFLLTALPFSLRVFKHDIFLGLLSPLFLFLRSSALGVGVVAFFAKIKIDA